MTQNFSISEEHGLAAMPADALKIYSVGVSTAGEAEVRMAEANPERHIIATTIDSDGFAATHKLLQEKGLNKQIEMRQEDVSKPLSYEDNYFDYIYARLVLHYLTKQQLATALRELHRVLKPGGSLFVVVRSTKNIDAHKKVIEHNETTGITTYESLSSSEIRKRFFHTQDSIASFISEAGFRITHTAQYDERLFHDYHRTKLSPHTDNLIELLAAK